MPPFTLLLRRAACAALILAVHLGAPTIHGQTAGAPRWAWAVSGGGASATDYCRGAACDAAGNTFVTGDFYGPQCSLGGVLRDSSGSGDAYVIKLTPDGATAWVRTFGGAGAEAGVDIATDRQGAAVLAGTFVSSPLNCGSTAAGQPAQVALPAGAQRGVLLVKLDSAGNTQWAAGFAGSGAAAGNEVVTGPSSEVLVIGPFAQDGGSSLTFPNGATLTKVGGDQDVFVAKFSADGVFQWGLGLNGDGHEEGRGIAVDGAGQVLVCGEFDNRLSFGSAASYATAGQSDIFVAKYSADGAYLWSRHFGGTGADTARGIAAAPDGTAFVSGQFSGTVQFDAFTLTAQGSAADLFLLKLDVNGRVLWARSFGSPGADQGCEIEADALGNVYCAGSASAGLAFPGGATLPNAGQGDPFVAKFDGAGNLLWATGGGGSGADTNFALGLDGQGRVTVVGSYAGSATYGANAISTGHGSSIDFYVARLEGDGSSASSSSSSALSAVVNLSTRVKVESGDFIGIAGFVIQGSGSKPVLIRALGPSLAAAGVSGVLADPQLTLVNSAGAVVAANDSWAQDPANPAALARLGLNAPQPSEAVISATLPPGSYTALVSGGGGATGVALVEVYDADPTLPSSLVNISTRGPVRTGDAVMIGGFVVSGASAKKVQVRALGPSLAAAGVPGTLANPVIDIYRGPTRIATNDDWAAQAAEGVSDVQATGRAPTGAAESSLVLTLPPGAYTAIVSGLNGTGGNALVEIYDLEPSPALLLAPQAVSLAPGGTQAFAATVEGSAALVAWSVVGSNAGTISATGLYTAPAAPGSYRVRATSTANASAFVEASVTVAAATPTELARFADAAAWSAGVQGDALLVMKNGVVVYENYVGSVNADSPHLLASGTKSFNVALFALGLADGLWTLDDLVADTITEWRGVAGKQDVRIRNLLSLTSGIMDSPAYSATNVANLDTYSLAINDSVVVYPPNQACIYAPSNFQVLAAMFERKTGRDPVQYLYDRLLGTLGFSQANLALWTRDAKGKPQMAGGAFFTAREWAQYGKLWLQNGKWQGRQLIDTATQNLAHTYPNPAFLGYGLSWWLNLPTGNTYNVGVDQIPEDGRGDGTQIATNAPADTYMAAGTGKQRLYVLPSQGLVVVRYGHGAQAPGWSDHTLLGKILGVP